jgi:hypothetical protein
MSSRDTILAGIARLRERWWRVYVLRHALQALFYLLLISALLLLVFKDLAPATLAVPLVGAAFLAGLGAAFLGRPSEAGLAKAFDDNAGLKDRVSSTIELMGREDPMVEALAEQAADAARSLEPKRVYPYSVPREGYWLPVPALLVAAVVFLPGLGNTRPTEDFALAASLEQRIAQLEEFLSEERDSELSPKQQELLEELQQLKAELDDKQQDRKDTMAEVAKVLENLQKARDEEEQKELELKKLLKGMQDKAGRKDLAEMLMNGEYSDALKKLKEELGKLAEELEKLEKEGASPEELKQLEAMLAEMKEMEAKMLELMQLDMDLEMMGEAIDFLAHWDGELGDLADLDPSQMVEPGEP